MFFDSISIPENYVGLVIGKKGRTIKKIEIKYSVKILIDNNIFYLYTTNSLNKLCKAKNHITDIYTKKILEEEKCPICIEPLDNSKDYTVTKCGHRFHLSCLTESLKNSEKCPMCREKLTDKKSIDKEKIINKTITQVRRTNYILNLSYYMSDFYSFQLVMEEFLREPLRYALSQVQ